VALIPYNSRFRVVWDVLAVALAMASFMLVSYQLAFVHRVILLGTIAVYAIDAFFLVDILLNFRTTFRRGGEEITERSEIRKRYLGSLFAVDLLATLPFDALLLGRQGVAWQGISVVLILRCLRLLRVARLFAIFRRWEQFSWTNSGSLRIAKFLLLIFLALHIVACAWFLVPYGRSTGSW
jgi:hypothetical protein